MQSDNDQITSGQAFTFLFLFIYEIRTLTAASKLGEAGPDAWLAMILGGLVIVTAGWLMGKLAMRFPEETLFEFAPRIAGSLLGRLMGVAFILFWTLFATRVLREVGDLAKSELLRQTPLEIIILIMLASSAYLARRGFEPISRVYQILIVPVIAVVVLIPVIAIPVIQMDNFRPFFAKGAAPIMKGAWDTFIGWEGMEAILFLLPYIADKRPALRVSVGAPLLVFVTWFAMQITVLGSLGAEEAMALASPGLDLAQVVDIPGEFFERVDSVYISIWLLVSYASIVAALHLSAMGIKRMAGLRDHKPWVFPLVPVVYFIALIAPSAPAAHQIGDILGLIFFGLGMALPALLLVIAVVRGIGTPPPPRE